MSVDQSQFGSAVKEPVKSCCYDIVQNGNSTNTNNNYIAKFNGDAKSVKKNVTMYETISKEKDFYRETNDYSTSQPDGCVKLRESPEEDDTPITIPTAFARTVAAFPQNHALAYKENDVGPWKYVTFQEYLKLVRTVAKAFLKLGLQRYHAVCILGRNTAEWFISDLAAIFAGGFASGIYTTNSPEACLHCMSLGRANIVIVENDYQLQKILKVKDQINDIKAIIQYSGQPTIESVFSWEDLLDIGNKESEEHLDSVINSLAVNECCSLLFTSGTTGPPKAVMLSHDNLIFATTKVRKYLRIGMGDGRMLSYLPLSHAAAQIADLYCGLFGAACCYFGDKNILKNSLIDNLKQIKPTLFFGVPRIWEKIKEGLERSEKNASTVQKFILSYAKSTATHHYKELVKGYDGESFAYKLHRRLLYSKVKQKLGLEKCTVCLVGAAPSSVAVREYLRSFDILICEIFGMSETAGPHIANYGSDVDFLSAGKSLPGTKTKIDKPDESGIGEVCMYGRNIFMGYLNDLDKTREVIDKEGWLHSGDTGICDDKSNIRIIGRIKELLITSGGENIAPVPIEMAIKTELPIISQAVLIGDARKFLSILLTLKTDINPETGEPLDRLSADVRMWCEKMNCNLTTVSDIIREKPKELYSFIEAGIAKVNDSAISQAQKIQKFTILSKDFSLVTGELGPTIKIIRSVVCTQYHDEIEAMYQ